MLISVCVIGLASTAALICEKYRESFMETVALSGVSFSSVILAMQIVTRNWALERGVAFFMASMAFYVIVAALRFGFLIRRYSRG